ncbi:MAG: TonB-dependent receptor [Bacteroidetes bacterium]|nr:TonB-dependent receptor [Bacteroidota bacterium]
MKPLFYLLAFFGLSLSAWAQTAPLTQTVRGKVVDKDTKSPLPGVVIMIKRDSTVIGGASTDVSGNYRVTGIGVGRITLEARYTGYQLWAMPNIILSSGKELIMDIELEQSAVQVNEVVIEASSKDGTNNEMSSVSGRMFSVEETNRYAGSRGDPARMASNFAGVQGADDSRNDIVVRGNSPMGVLWRLEGVDIPNPNHFAIEGTTGGPVSMINNKVLANSDFFTGAFPAEYGNSIAAAFDLRMRNGNNERFEFNGQFGFLGTELTAEGPLNKAKGSSFLINYRYSTLRLFEAANIPIGTGAVPNYQDAAFKLNFPLRKGGNLSFFGLGGLSNINILVSKYTEPSDELYGEDSRDQQFATGMGVAGMVYTKPLNDKTLFRAVVAASHRQSKSFHALVWRNVNFGIDSITPKMGYQNNETRYTFNFSFTRKLGSRNVFKAGMFNEMFGNTLVDSIHSEQLFVFRNRQDYEGTALLLQPYAQWKFRATDLLVFNAGVHAQYFTLNGSTAVEPRAGVRWTVAPKHTLSAGVGMHSQILPAYIYYTHLPATSEPYVLHNKNLDFMRSLHSVVGYDWLVTPVMRLKVETYYQQLYDVPVEKKSSSFSVLNQGSGFSRFFPDTLVNTGSGTNYGVEVTLEKFFAKGYFFLFTASVFDAKYKGSDGVTRNTDFNTGYAANALAAREWKLGERQTIQLGGKITMAGKRWYTPIDTAASKLENDEVLVDSLRNSLQFSKAYFRVDLKVLWRLNSKKVTHEIGIDFVNVLNRKNILGLTYSPNPLQPSANPVVEQYQLGFLPLFYYQIDF